VLPLAAKGKTMNSKLKSKTPVGQPRLVRILLWYALRWLRGPVGIMQGIAQTLSMGFWEPSWILKIEGWFLDYSAGNADIFDANAIAQRP
jgi:hypothetical protein